ncbi:MAG: hypothetical protein HY826_11375 [Actinobacteria bacterium]|nr:hypothetical protein [Actinomycetota bacterium]
MDRQYRVSTTHWACGNVVALAGAHVAVELAVDEGVEVATVAKMIEALHEGGNPSPTKKLPAE